MVLSPANQRGGSPLGASSLEPKSDHAGRYSREWTGDQLYGPVLGDTACFRGIRDLAKEVIIWFRLQSQ